MSSKKSFLLYCDQRGLFDKLPNELAGALIKHIFSYVNDEDPKSDNMVIEIAFESIRMQLSRDLDKWEHRVENSRKNGSKGGRPKNQQVIGETQKTQRVIGETQKTQRVLKKPRKPVNDNVNDNVNDTVNDNVNVNDKKNKGVVLPFDTENFKTEWAIWKQHRVERKFGNYAPIGEQAALMKLSKMSDGDEATAISIIRQSIENDWKGFYDLKDEQKNGHSKNTGGVGIAAILRDIR